MSRRHALLALLALAAGSTDATAYLELGKVFTANMTGNTVLFGIAIVNGEGLRVARSGCALGGFCVGVACAALALGPRLRGRSVRPRLTPALALQLGPLVSLAIAAAALRRTEALTFGLICASALAMGAQSATVRAFGPPGVNATYITGTITTVVAGAVRSLAAGSSRDPDTPHQDGHQAGLSASVWIVYFGGAVAGALAASAWSLQATWIAVLAVATVMVLAHHHQSELARPSSAR